MLELTYTKLHSWSDDAPRDLATVRDGQLLTIGFQLRTFAVGETWVELVDKAAGDASSAGSNVEYVLEAWGATVGVMWDGSLRTFDGASWQPRTPPVPTFNPKHKANNAYCVFDPGRDLLVLWGRQTKNGRRDDTFVHDGTTWTKCKKSKVATENVAASRDFVVYYDPTERAVLRVGETTVGVFDGATWTQFPIEGEPLRLWYSYLHDIVDERAWFLQQLGVDRFVRMVRRGDRFVAEPAAKLASIEGGWTQMPGAYDRTNRRLLVLRRGEGLYAIDVAPLVTR